MDPVSIVNEAASSNNVVIKINENIAPTMQPLDFHKAATDGNFDPFGPIVEKLNLVVTPIKNTVLHINIASEKVSTEFVEDVLGICPSLLLQVNAQGDTPLHVAVKFERIDVVKALIKHAKAQQPEDLESGIGPAAIQMLRMTNNNGNTALHEAMRRTCLEVVKILSEEDSGFSYYANHCGETPLYIAAETGFLKGAIELLTCTVVSHDGPNGKTSLHAAVRRNHQDLTREILKKKKNLTKGIDDNGWTPLHCAVYYGHIEVMHILLKFDQSPAYVGDKKRKMTPLHLAASQGHIDMIKCIILYCPDCYELVDARGWNVLHFAMATLSEDELFNLLEIPLIKKLAHEKDRKGNTPLHVRASITQWFSLIFFRDIINKVGGDTKVVNKSNVTVTNVLKLGSPELKKEINELSQDIGDGSYPLSVSREDKLENDILKYLEEAKESHLVVATLITTVTFAAAFTLPGGYKSEEGKNQGTSILSRNAAFQIFVISDAIAMVFSMFAVFSYFLMSLKALPLKKYLPLFKITPWFVVIAMGAMVIAFVTGTYAVLSPSLGLAIATCFIGLIWFLVGLPVGCRIILQMLKVNLELVLKSRKLRQK